LEKFVLFQRLRTRQSSRWLALFAALLLLASVGCGGGDGDAAEAEERGSAPKAEGAPKPGSNVPTGGKTVVAKVFTEPPRGIPADVGQWMIEIGVVPGDDLAFTVAKAVVPSGNANFHLKNPQAVEHELAIEAVRGSVSTFVFRPGWIRASLFAGKRYVFYCSVPGHREEGMEGAIKIDPRLQAEDLKAF
jgi:hypothetical protein